jgi:hypothetical protein
MTYALQNLENIIKYVTEENLGSLNLLTVDRYGGPTVLTLLAINVFLFHGLTSLRPLVIWLPLFVSATLLATVHVAPGVGRIVTILGEEPGRPVETPRDQAMDMEQGQDPLPGMAEHPFGYRRHRSMGSILSYIRGLPEIRNLEPHDEGIDGSVELDVSSISTTTEVRLLVQPLDPVPDLAPQYIALAPINPMDEQSVYFPQTPQGQPLEMPFPGSTSRPTTEDSSMELLVPG